MKISHIEHLGIAVKSIEEALHECREFEPRFPLQGCVISSVGRAHDF